MYTLAAAQVVTEVQPTVDASGAASWAWLLVALPLLGAAIILLGGRSANRWGPTLANVMSWGAFGLGAAILIEMLGRAGDERAQSLHLWQWFTGGSFEVNAGMLVDQLSISFVMLVTFVGSLIHVYSLGYMEHDPDKGRFFGYLNLFIAAMLTLVLADSYVLLFLGWEGVGLASYLLIGFWYQRSDYASAANKAFIVNRVGDMALAIGIAMMFVTFGSADYSTVHGGAAGAPEWALTAIGLLLLGAACGKSAQFPLQSWLGDAMAGPTPVSALIHAATMVTAGVYLIVRSNAIFDLAPTARLVVTIVGAITLLLGAFIGMAKDDIKKALAASTMSQIGYMMLAAGLGPVGYVFAIFHLLTHGFFKAGMFLGAGSVMHAMNDQVNMRRFGRLSGVLKHTWWTFGLGWLAIIGFPGLSGWWSKDKIIEAAFVGEGWQPWVFGLVTMLGAGLTAFYMSRLFFMTFHGSGKRWTEDVHPHESPLVMTVPMMILAVGSLALGAILTAVKFPEWLAPVTNGGHLEHHEPVLAIPAIQILTFVLMAAGVFVAWRLYWKADVPVVAPEGSALTQAARTDFYQDDVNEAVFVGPLMTTATGLVEADDQIVDGGARNLGDGVAGLSRVLRRAQTGFVRSYALTMLAGVVAVLGALWVMN
ncbi:NADH-quinone oxidoreductase subunit L [Kribbia dieselivorans]|uniref:NADH-quinone oxidoreductase subunit L n=1 Tax=Kribbia dieselivorans TaxID=331526 RepID=UPI0008392E1E|nr:NADH-quinone oxidoreductase subunit L [Kribbia dieselivorans]